MKKAILVTAALAVAAAAFAGQQPAAQQPAAPQSSSPVAKQPQPKSQAELQALQGIQQAATPQDRQKLIDDFVVKFPDSDFKSFALMVAAGEAQARGDHDKAILYGERSLEADPNNYMVLGILATEYAGTTRENDLDKEEKLKKAEGYANKGLEMIKTAPRPRPDITDEQWAAAKRDQMEPQFHSALAMAASVRKNCDVAINEYKAALNSSQPDLATEIRLGAMYNKCNRPDDAIATLDKVINSPTAPPNYKQIAQAERVRAIQKKGGAAPAAPGAAPSTPAPAPAPAPAAAPKP